jgi:hypothetical protein
MDDFREIFNRLAAEHYGGVENVDMASAAIIRAMARLLASDDLDAKGAQSVASLAALLPPRQHKMKSLEVHFVRPADTELSKQCDALHERVAELELQLRASENAAKTARSDAQEAASALSAARAAPPPQPSVFTPTAIVPQSNAELWNSRYLFGSDRILPEW